MTDAAVARFLEAPEGPMDDQNVNYWFIEEFETYRTLGDDYVRPSYHPRPRGFQERWRLFRYHWTVLWSEWRRYPLSRHKVRWMGRNLGHVAWWAVRP